MAYIIQGMRDLLAKGENLPTLPAAVFQLHKVLDDEMAGPAQVAAIIEGDPALTGRLLRAANAAAFNRGDRIGSVAAAVRRLGIDQIRTICLVLAVVRAFPNRSTGLDHQLFWLHSATVGMMSEYLWNRFGSARDVPSADIYTAGLLHDVGLLILEQFFQRDFQEARHEQLETGHRLWQCEESHLGMDHGAVGGLLLGRWSLPAYISEAVTNHHHPEQAEPEYRDISRIVYAAEAICTEQGVALLDEGGADCPSEEILAELGCPEEETAKILDQVPIMVERAREFLN
ncbi:MAG: HDOD domain-containing protein [Gemmatimonadota bacterium]